MLKGESGLPEMPVMSMGFLVDPNEAVIWRGPMLHGSINQFLGMTEWGDLDYLIIDAPPGTGDEPLTIAQMIKKAKAIIVTTPQEVALIDARKGIAMFKKVNVPIDDIIIGYTFRKVGGVGYGGYRSTRRNGGLPYIGVIVLNADLFQRNKLNLDSATDYMIHEIGHVSCSQKAPSFFWYRNGLRSNTSFFVLLSSLFLNICGFFFYKNTVLTLKETQEEQLLLARANKPKRLMNFLPTIHNQALLTLK